MAVSKTEKRPVRKLTVENFSVIKDAKLEFGKITVLIGPQASGKSLLCKLAYFLTRQTIEDALVAILSQNAFRGSPFDEFKVTLRRDFLVWFPLDTWQNEGARVTFESHVYRVQISATKQLDGVEVSFSRQFESLFAKLADLVQAMPASGSDSSRYIAEQLRAQFSLLATEIFIDRPLYIPDGRAFFANQSLGFNVVNNPDIDPIIKEFSLEVSWGSGRSPDPVLGEEGVRILYEINREILTIAGGHVEGRNGSATFKRTADGKSIPLPLLSSGTQAMLPMFNVLWRWITEQRGRNLFPRPDNLPGMPNQLILSKALVYVEEPESNVFPKTQYDLMRLFAWLSSEPRLDFQFAITTHSPYILTSFNALLGAGKAAKARPEKIEEIRKVIPQKCWIAEGDLIAYAFDGKDGILHRAMDQETGLINGDVLDSVSDKIGAQFDELLDIEYAKHGPR